MPTSNLEVIEPIMRFVMDINPRSILDIGIGFGKYGFLCREYLETLKNRSPCFSAWKARIDGVEVFTDYISPHHWLIYNHIYKVDIERHLEIIANPVRDLYIMTDVLEHFDNWSDVLRAIPLESALVVSTPNGEYPQGERFGNVYEKHRATFSVDVLSATGLFTSVEVVKDTILALRKS